MEYSSKHNHQPPTIHLYQYINSILNWDFCTAIFLAFYYFCVLFFFLKVHFPPRRYMRGRVSYDQLNGTVQAINTAVKAKYKILHQPLKALNNHSRKLHQRFKEQETKDTKGTSSSGIQAPILDNTEYVFISHMTTQRWSSLLRFHFFQVSTLWWRTTSGSSLSWRWTNASRGCWACCDTASVSGSSGGRASPASCWCKWATVALSTVGAAFFVLVT